MVYIACPTKFWAFSLAEQLHRYNLLEGFFTSFASQKNVLLNPFIRRKDNEKIPPALISTYLSYAFKARLRIKDDFLLNEEFDRWVASQLKRDRKYSIFIGWASIAQHSIRQAKQDGRITILERGSCHIDYQNNLLKEEYKKFDVNFNIDPRVVDKELIEYDQADFISIPSLFVKRSFIEMGISEKKLIVNNYGSSLLATAKSVETSRHPFRIIYFGSLSVRKGLIYLFEALKKLDFEYEAWFIGQSDGITKKLIKEYNNPNWKIMDPMPQARLPEFISQCDVFVMPSIEDGFGMVVPQSISLGVPVIATNNVGGIDIIEAGRTGFIVPVKNAEAIAKKLCFLFENPKILASMKDNCRKVEDSKLSWNNYGDRYVTFLKTRFEHK